MVEVKYEAGFVVEDEVDDDVEELVVVVPVSFVYEDLSTLENTEDRVSVDDEPGFEVVAVVLPTLVLGDVVRALEDDVVVVVDETESEDDLLSPEDWVAVLCEDPATLEDGVVEIRLDDEPAFEDSVDLVEASVDVVLDINKIFERVVDLPRPVDETEDELSVVVVPAFSDVSDDMTDEVVTLDEVSVLSDVGFEFDEVVEIFGGDSVVEDVRDGVSVVDDVFPELVEVREDRVDDTSVFEGVEDVVDVDKVFTSGLFEVVKCELLDDSVLETTGDPLPVVDDILPELSEIREDEVDDPTVFEDVEKVAVVEVGPVSVPPETVGIVEIVEDVKVVDLDAVPRCDETVESTGFDEVWTLDAVEDVAGFDIDVALVCDETVEGLVEEDFELADVLDVVSVEVDDFTLSVKVADGTNDDDSVLEDAKDVGSDGILVIPSWDKRLKANFSSREGELACGIAASK